MKLLSKLFRNKVTHNNLSKGRSVIMFQKVNELGEKSIRVGIVRKVVDLDTIKVYVPSLDSVVVATYKDKNWWID